ncbi:hypothetical protein ACLIOB_003387 [Vibrio cholerae]|uniref:hypothetical protein n=1 Tax=Vibrio TaxID=662 RepID=UPI000A9883B6|nr:MULTISPECIES: hypothetical protein [Vibrio]EHK7543379.1 hypothetical protein [Vibrio cholerae]EJL6339964.1 hypothetical protein [Vibrio cholerae]EJL6470951.1 hypothetical protein [Vibrio cholerae]EJL6717518.1 hypothetical protein [Vibrio cholerae]ELJ8549600.1 hypothetical protein [Vibrio cholerae]
MVEKIGHIKNPLTVISIFAAIAEISGTTVLPFIEPENQRVYVWFLMLFPVFLVGIFFLTLNFNHRVLYAPSDYKDEKNFVDPYGKASPEEQGKKLREEVKELESEDNADNEFSRKNEDKSAEADAEKVVRMADESDISRRRQFMADVALAERLAVNKLSRELGINFKTDVRINLPDLRGSAFYDALGIDDNEVHAVEVKLFKSNRIDPSRFASVLEQSEAASLHFKGFDSREFTLHIFAVMDTPDVDVNMLKNTLNTFSKRYKVSVKIHITTLNALQGEYK